VVRGQRATVACEVLRQQRLEVLDGRCSRQLGVEVGQIGVRLDAVRASGADDRVQVRARLGAKLGIAEQPDPAPESHHAVILPISGRKLKFTTAGIRFIADEFERITASNAPAAVSSISSSSRAS